MSKAPRARAGAPKGAKATEPRLITLASIVADERAQSRAGRDEGVVAEYAEAMAAGERFPPLVVFEESDRFWLAEGFHRLGGAQAAGLAEVECDVRPGGLRDAILHSAGANASHGLRRTNADKRRAVLMLLEDEEWGAWADREIARRCAVSQPLVGRIRDEHLQQFADAPRTVARGGKVFSMDTARIGRRAAEPGPTPPADAPAEPKPVHSEANVVQAAERFNVMPAPEAIERKLVSEEAASEIEAMEDYDASRLDHRATAVNYALGMLEHIPITGREYWKVYGESPKREAFIKWVVAAKKIIDDIAKEYENVRNAKA